MLDKPSALFGREQWSTVITTTTAHLNAQTPKRMSSSIKLYPKELYYIVISQLGSFFSFFPPKISKNQSTTLRLKKTQAQVYDCFFLSFFSPEFRTTTKQNQRSVTHGTKNFLRNKCTKVTHFEGKQEFLKLPYLDNGFPTSSQNIGGFFKILYFPLWAVAKFGFSGSFFLG